MMILLRGQFEEPDFEWRELINDHCEHLEIPLSGILLDMKLESA
jgi:hypothetical protein